MSRKILAAVVLVIILLAGWFFFSARSSVVKEPGTALADPSTERVLKTGRVVGFVDSLESHAWLGIPFAKPPVGDLRWKAPVGPEPWIEPLAALRVESMCTQPAGRLNGHPDAGPDDIAGEEDCLYLNVWAPPYDKENIPRADHGLPVMFWIHGGGNSIGHAGQETYNGSALATTHQLVVVSVNYRLGPFGWFPHPALKDSETSPEDNSGNFGTLDIIRGLEWVRENIAEFGGNPENVTIFGESAGGVNVLSMMASPRAKGLFHRAIVQSGGLRVNPLFVGANYSDDLQPGHRFSAREIVNLSLIRDGLVKDREEAKSHQNHMPDAEIAQYLRSKSNRDIISLYAEKFSGMITMPQLFADGAVLPLERIENLFKAKNRFNSVPVILGTNRDEAKLFMALDPRNVKRVLWVFPRLKNPEAYERQARYQSDAWKVRGVDSLAGILRDTQGPTVFGYRFDWDEERSIMGYDLSKALGAAHGMEIPFVFNNFAGPGLTGTSLYRKDKAPGRDALSRSMMSYWAQFAYTGNPGKGRDGNEVEWKAWDNASDASEKFIVFDTSEDQGIRMVSEEITLEDIKARLMADERFETQEEYCRTYVELFRLSPLWDKAEYESLGKEGCSGFDPALFRR
ncbi:MAG: carboxylesterase family protein [Proteobacteria bacterium]|nr:carboxylesterase family protein [Pseudomonadota bacterium]